VVIVSFVPNGSLLDDPARSAPPAPPPVRGERTPPPRPAAGPRPGLHWRNAWTILQRHFRENQLLLRASALTYATLLSAVPFLAVVLAVIRAFGIEERVLPWVVARLRIGGDQVTAVLLSLVQRLNPAALGAAGALGLVVAAFLLLAQVDSAFNAVWGVRENRKLTARLVGYGGVLVLGPLWVAVWTTVLSWARMSVSTWSHEWSSLGYLLVRIASPALGLVVLTLLYLIAPNTRVRLTAAFLGALGASVFLELNQFVFVSWVKTSVGYSVVYGAFAAVPIFLFWMYSNWVAVLVGLEVAYLVQNVPTWLREAKEPEHLAWEDRERLALAAAALLAARGELDAERLGEALEISPRLMHRPLDDLQDAGWIDPVSDANGQVVGYRGRPVLARATLAELRRSLRALGEDAGTGVRQRALLAAPAWMAVLEPLERDADRPFETWSALDLAERLAARR
jgi:membrane protein